MHSMCTMYQRYRRTDGHTSCLDALYKLLVWRRSLCISDDVKRGRAVGPFERVISIQRDTVLKQLHGRRVRMQHGHLHCAVECLWRHRTLWRCVRWSILHQQYVRGVLRHQSTLWKYCFIIPSIYGYKRIRNRVPLKYGKLATKYPWIYRYFKTAYIAVLLLYLISLHRF